MRAEPEGYAHELGQVARETGTAIEINVCANLENTNFSDRYVKEYVAYLSIIAEEGASFALDWVQMHMISVNCPPYTLLGTSPRN